MPKKEFLNADLWRTLKQTLVVNCGVLESGRYALIIDHKFLARTNLQDP